MSELFFIANSALSVFCVCGWGYNMLRMGEWRHKYNLEKQRADHLQKTIDLTIEQARQITARELSIGTKIGEQERKKANSYSDEKRRELLERGLAMIKSESPPGPAGSSEAGSAPAETTDPGQPDPGRRAPEAGNPSGTGAGPSGTPACPAPAE